MNGIMLIYFYTCHVVLGKTRDAIISTIINNSGKISFVNTPGSSSGNASIRSSVVSSLLLLLFFFIFFCYFELILIARCISVGVGAEH